MNTIHSNFFSCRFTIFGQSFQFLYYLRFNNAEKSENYTHIPHTTHKYKNTLKNTNLILIFNVPNNIIKLIQRLYNYDYTQIRILHYNQEIYFFYKICSKQLPIKIKVNMVNEFLPYFPH